MGLFFHRRRRDSEPRYGDVPVLRTAVQRTVPWPAAEDVPPERGPCRDERFAPFSYWEVMYLAAGLGMLLHDAAPMVSPTLCDLGLAAAEHLAWMANELDGEGR